MKITYATPTGEKTVECEAYTASPGEGVNGPYILTFFDNAEKEGAPFAMASRVIEYGPAEEG